MILLKIFLTTLTILQIQMPLQTNSLNQEDNKTTSFQQESIIENKDDITLIREKIKKCKKIEILFKNAKNQKKEIKEESKESLVISNNEIETKKSSQNTDITKNKELYKEIIDEIIILTNQERIANGLNELKYDDELTNIAMERALEGANNNYFSHTRPNGEDFSILYEEYNIKYTICGENLGRYQTSAQQVFTEWMNSPTHKENILYDFDYIGVGVAIDSEGNYYFAQEFKKE